MPDFQKLRSERSQIPLIDPIEIFRRLPKPVGINDLYSSQDHVLKEWNSRRNGANSDKDVVIKLHTGGGKTLVGLLIAQAILNEKRQPVVYLSPTVQLVEQTLAKASDYGIPAVPYQKNGSFQSEFLNGQSVLICTYEALFNGLSRFGIRGGTKEVVQAGAVILDDAHVAFGNVRDAYTLKISNITSSDDYQTLAGMFRSDFSTLGRLGTFDDIVSGKEVNVVEVPYWSWKNRVQEVREYLRSKEPEKNYLFVWPLLRDCLEYCHALISRDSFVISPIFPMMDMFPTFADCSCRIFMSATIRDDSAIIHTFDANKDFLSKPITSNSLAGVGERMILSPELMPFSINDLSGSLKKLITWSANDKDAGTLILVPSDKAAKAWQDAAETCDTPDKVNAAVRQLQDGSSRGPFVFANRYDGIDLPGQACRLLVLDGLPRGASEFDLYRATALSGGASLNSALAQRIEQGMGRGARGGGDYCVVVLTGKDLIAWIGREANTKFLSSSTRAQLEIGSQVSKNVTDLKDSVTTINSCFKRDKNWTEYHAETLAELVKEDQVNADALEDASVERKAFKLWRDGYHDRAIYKLETHCNSSKTLDAPTKGWLLQLAARIAFHKGDQNKASQLQQHAYAYNRNLFKPQTALQYTLLLKPGKQSELIVAQVLNYSPRQAFLAAFEGVVSRLVPESSANQFEQALSELGVMLGFASERPEHIYGVGPDVLWLLGNNTGLVIEAKSRKFTDNAFNKENHGQLLVATEWFKREYSEYKAIRVSIHPNVIMTKEAIADDSKVFTLTKLNELISNARQLFTSLSEGSSNPTELSLRCEQLLTNFALKSDNLVSHYLVPFQIQQS